LFSRLCLRYSTFGIISFLAASELSSFTGKRVPGDEHTRDLHAALRPGGTRFAEELLRRVPSGCGTRGLIPAALDENIQHGPMLVDGAPEVGSFSVDLQKDLSQMPFISGFGASSTKLIGLLLAELRPWGTRPLPHRFIGHDDPALSQHLFDITVAEWKAKVQPDGMADDVLREAVSFVRRCYRAVHVARIA
jgi:hypothetical protein